MYEFYHSEALKTHCQLYYDIITVVYEPLFDHFYCDTLNKQVFFLLNKQSFRRNMALIFSEHLLWPNATWESSWHSKGIKKQVINVCIACLYSVCVYSYMRRQHLVPVPDGKGRCRHSKCSTILSQWTLCKRYLSQL